MKNTDQVTLLLFPGTDKTIDMQESLNGFSALMRTVSSDVSDDTGLEKYALITPKLI
ncbi:MAG: hypothetical protein JXJ04_08675 [Spirochaetales bacterium]|nr:hypothetical protein [Spirochaetales bacterium]